MRGLAAYCLAALVVTLATCVLAAVIPMPAVSAGTVARDGVPVQWVDRAGKGDRLDFSTSIDRQPQRPPMPLGHRDNSRNTAPKLMPGCEPVFSPLATAHADNVAGRCTA